MGTCLGVGCGGSRLIFGDCRAWMTARMAVAHLALLQIVLQQVAPVVHGLGRLDLEADPAAELVDLPEHVFEFFA